jgi:hypothetical protein
MPVTAEKPVTRSEFDARMALAKQYGPQCVTNLIAEFRRRVAPAERLELMDCLADPSLQKCGIEAAVANEPSVPASSTSFEKRANLTPARKKVLADLEAEWASVNDRPTHEQIQRHIKIMYGTDEEFASMATRVAKSYTPTTAQILQHDGLCSESSGL